MTYDDQLDVISQEQNSADVLAQLPSLESIRSSLYRARHEDTPILPNRCQSLYQILKHLEVGKTSSWLTMEMMTRSDSCLMQRPFTLMAHSQHTLHCSTRYIIMYMNIFINLFSAGVYNPYSAYISNGIAFCLTIMLLKDAALVKFPGISFDVEVVVSAGHGSNSYIMAVIITSCKRSIITLCSIQVQALGLARRPNGELKEFVQLMATDMAFHPTGCSEHPKTTTWINGNFPPIHWTGQSTSA